MNKAIALVVTLGLGVSASHAVYVRYFFARQA